MTPSISSGSPDNFNSKTTSTRSLSLDIELFQDAKIIPQKRMLTPFFSKKIPPVPTEDERIVYPMFKANPVSRVFFWWLMPLLVTGYKRTLQPADVYKLDQKAEIDYMHKRFMSFFEPKFEELKKQHLAEHENDSHDINDSGKSHQDKDTKEFMFPLSALVNVIFKTFWYECIKSITQVILFSAAGSCAPLLQKKLIEFVQLKAFGYNPAIGKGVGYSIGVSLLIMTNVVLNAHGLYHSMIVGGKIRSVLIKALLEKSLKLDAKGHHDFPDGKINSIMSTDLNRIDFASMFAPLLFGSPVQFAISLGLLISNIGVSSLVGLGLFIFSMALLVYLIKTFQRLRGEANKFTDKRVNLVKEILKNFKVVKYYGWEDAYFKKVLAERTNETGALYKVHYLRTTLQTIAFCLPNITSMVSFCVMYAINYGASIADIFSSLSLFTSLAQAFINLPVAVATTVDSAVGLTRVCEVLSAGEIDTSVSDEVESFDENVKYAVKVTDATFEWDNFGLEKGDDDDKEEDADSEKDKKKSKKDKKLKSIKEIEKPKSDDSSDMKNIFPGLNNINLEIDKGEFVVITGSIGSGKSSLLQALSGFMKKTSGVVSINGSLLLCGYPWVQNTTVKENITFGAPFDKSKYQTVVEACSLPNDFKQLPGGDMTEVGERGITLSGGQKARINLARAVYAGKDIILMDDVLSAVDAKVGKHIVESCIMGYLKGKTRVLATHQLSLIGSADKVVFLNGDGSIDAGSLQELIERNTAFKKLMEHAQEVAKKKEQEDKIYQEEEEQLKRITTTRTNTETVKIAEEEEMAVNKLGWDVYGTYIKLGSGVFGLILLPLYLTVMMIYTFCSIFSNNWLSFWVSNKYPDRSDHFYIGLYIMFSLLAALFMIVGLILLAYGAVTASKNLNLLATKRLMKVPLSYTDITPMGRILNRFTKDTDVLDNEMISQISFFVANLFNVVGSLILCVIYLPWFAIAVPFMFIILAAVSDFYQASAREIKRWEAVHRSFVYSNFNEVLSGMDTVKAYHQESRFLDTSDALIDKMNEFFWLTASNQRWFAMCLCFLTTCFALLISLLCVFRVFHIDASSTGLLLTYVLVISNTLYMMFRSMTTIENEMNSAERLKYYAMDLPQEAAFDIPEKDPAPEWPERGDISFKNVCLKYRPGLPYVLKDLNVSIKSNERIGICGRTGAGKSTLMTCLYRLAEPEGLITIDGVDISQLGLRKLRSKLSIIPQDPVLFSGTVRTNLDPFEETTDDKLWEALRKAHLIEESVLDKVISQTQRDESMHKFHLDQMVEDDGINFSLGERQLLALARALVRSSKILILDEATSSVDYETDSKIQGTIANEFNDYTILCIAHRLKTIVNYDKILVMDKGEVEEFDTPWKLYNKKDGLFRSMCDQSSIGANEFVNKV